MSGDDTDDASEGEVSHPVGRKMMGVHGSLASNDDEVEESILLSVIKKSSAELEWEVECFEWHDASCCESVDRAGETGSIKNRGS